MVGQELKAGYEAPIETAGPAEEIAMIVVITPPEP